MTGQFYINAILILLPIGVLAMWWNGARAKELAVGHARNLCQRENVQLLDYTVGLKHMRLSRNASGSHCLKREYGFEFTVQGEQRDQGSVVLNGHTLAVARLPYTRDDDGNRVFLQ